jgi:hypothetical protein
MPLSQGYSSGQGSIGVRGQPVESRFQDLAFIVSTFACLTSARLADGRHMSRVFGNSLFQQGFTRIVDEPLSGKFAHVRLEF